jgi:RNA polymerase sigma-70 factor (ECF subfamily)
MGTFMAEEGKATETGLLLERARRGDGDALERVLERYVPRLRRWASGRLPKWARDCIDTDDLVQETVLHTLRHVDGFEPRGPGAFHAYVRQALANRIRNELRNAARRPPIGGLDSNAAAEQQSPLEQAIGRERLARYDDALARLEPFEREAVVSRVELGLSYQELAEVTGRPSADAARMAVGRALVKLAVHLRTRAVQS